MNRKVKKGALKSALSLRFKTGTLTVLNQLQVEQVSTKSFAEVLGLFELNNVLIVVGDENANVELSARNIPHVKVLRTDGVNVFDVMKYRNILITEEAVAKLEGALA